MSALLLMLLAAINYQNSLAYALTFLLGRFVVAILHTYRNLAGLIIKAGSTPAVFVGEPAVFAYAWKAVSGRIRPSAWVGRRPSCRPRRAGSRRERVSVEPACVAARLAGGQAVCGSKAAFRWGFWWLGVGSIWTSAYWSIRVPCRVSCRCPPGPVTIRTRRAAVPMARVSMITKG